VIAIPASLVLAFFSRQVLLVWTGNAVVSHRAAPVLSLYALGNGILALGSFPYFLQFAKGDLKLHLIGTALFLFILLPSLIWCTFHYGMVGAGYSWLFTNGLFFIFWVPIVHRRFVKGLHGLWLLHDVAAIVILSSTCAVLMSHFVVWPDNRIHIVILIAMLSGILVVIAAASSSWVRQFVFRQKGIAMLFSSNRTKMSDRS
jgi:O-antigen/teichoic acid export membrane protein